MNYVTLFMTRNPHYRENVKFRPTGISVMTIHKAQPSAKVLISNQNNEKCRSMCPHAIIDYSGTVYQTLPWNVKSPNSIDNIVVLLCEPGDIKYEKDGTRTIMNQERAVGVEEQIYQAAVDLCAQICYQKGIDPNTSIQFPANPKEVAELWSALGMQKTADTFRSEVVIACKAIKYAEEALKAQTKAEQTPEVDVEQEKTPVTDAKPEKTSAVDVEQEKTSAVDVEQEKTSAADAKPEKTQVVDRELEPTPVQSQTPAAEPPKTYQVRIDVDRLRIRSTPEVSSQNITGKYTGKGTFTITEIQNGSGSAKGWGKLESGGWISLDHVVML